ncbi:hypothetical protein UPYG_G00140870 [Umbra pygmaea]|uniref:DBF4-type domain-containing protein n=1 Tax=Umbra pygmaea TaxID=75934 RepID=A0ABD0WZU4_UMBPY
MQQHQPGAGGRLLGLLAPGPGSKKLEGKSFYLDAVKGRHAAILVEAISHLGGKIESFLNKDISFVVTGKPEGLSGMRSEQNKGGSDGTSGGCSNLIRFNKPKESIMTSTRQQRPATGTPRPTVCGSRGMALLEKAIRNNERLHGNSVLANARSWGVKIVHVDDLLAYVQLLTAESSKARRRKTEAKSAPKCPVVSRVKAVALKSPYLKVEDSSRKHKPLHMQSMTFPSLCYSGRFSPFEPPAPPQPEGSKEQRRNKTRQVIKSSSRDLDKPDNPLPRTTSPCRARKKNLGYCECCNEPFKDQDEHLQSAVHRGFVQDPSHYSSVDQLVADMDPGFAPCPPSETGTALLRLDPPTPPLQRSHSPSEMQTYSETELAIQALLTQGSPPDTQTSILLSPGRAAVTSYPQSPTCPDYQPLSPKAPCQFPSPACPPSLIQPFSQGRDPQNIAPLPADTQILNTCPDTLSQPPSRDSKASSSIFAPIPSDSLPLSSCPESLDQPPSPYCYPPILSPQYMLPFDSSSQPDGPYSLPPVLSPQAPTEGQGMVIDSPESAPEKVEPVPQNGPTCTPLFHSSGKGLGSGLRKPNQQRFLFGNNQLMESQELVCEQGGVVLSTNPKKRRRSASPEAKASKGRKTAPTQSEPIQVFSTTVCTKQQDSVPSELTDQNAPIRILTWTEESTEDNITSWPPVGVFGQSQDATGRKHLSSCSFAQLPPQSTNDAPGRKERSIYVDRGFLQRPCPATIKLGASSPMQLHQQPLDGPTHLSTYSQDSKPSDALSALCIDTALLPEFDTLSPSDSDSDWECDLMVRLGPSPTTPPSALSLQPQQLDMELLQRPCSSSTLHETSYESRLCSVLQQPPTPPPEPSPPIQSVEVTQH